jgi:hypothetical protein
MTTRGTPASSQIIWLENRVKELEAMLAAQPARQQEPIYYMRDNHTFKRLSEDVPTALIEIEAEFNEGYTFGMLCSKREGFENIHASGSPNRLGFLNACKKRLESIYYTTPQPNQQLYYSDGKGGFYPSNATLKEPVADKIKLSQYKKIEVAVRVPEDIRHDLDEIKSVLNRSLAERFHNLLALKKRANLTEVEYYVEGYVINVTDMQQLVDQANMPVPKEPVVTYNVTIKES